MRPACRGMRRWENPPEVPRAYGRKLLGREALCCGRSLRRIPMTKEPAARKMFIAGEWRDATGGATIPVENPATEEIIATVPKGTVEDAKAAADAAYDARSKVGKISAWERYQFLLRTARLLEERVEEMANLISLEAGKPIRDARVEARRAGRPRTPGAEGTERTSWG